MGESFTLGSLAYLSLDELVRLVNRAYVDSPGPFSPEEPIGYAAFCREQAIDLARSVLARDAAGAPIGFGLLGIRQERGWIGDFAVLPAWRRHGVGRALLDTLLGAARAAGLRDVRLEVTTANAPAQQLYAAAGFRLARTLHSYAATAGQLGLSGVAPPLNLILTAVAAAVLALDLDLPADPAPAWDHELPALLVASGTRTLLALRQGEPAGLLHYRPGPDNVEIRRLAVRDGAPAIAGALLHAASGSPATSLVAAYAGADSPLLALLPALGFQEMAPDLEMIHQL